MGIFNHLRGCRWTSTLVLHSRVPRLAPFFSFLACRASLIGQGLLVAFVEELCVNRLGCLAHGTPMPRPQACVTSEVLCACSIATTVFLITSKPHQAGYQLGPAMMLYLYCMLVVCHVSLHCLPLRIIAQSAFWVNVATLLGQPAHAHV